MPNLKFLVTCTKSDLWMTKICIASIRYYYPSNEIFVIKDKLLGDFSINELVKFWNVDEITYETDMFGISASKMFFYVDENFGDDFFMVLDSDIVLMGQLDFDEFDFDVAVSVEYEKEPSRQIIRDLYFDITEMQKYGYNFPGYFFNAGQLVCKRGFLFKWKDELSEYFDFKKLPRWIKLDILPKHDQSLINYFFPKLESEKKLKIGKFDFMIWTGWESANKFSLKEIRETGVPYLLHYAGAYRNKYVSKMARPDILNYFRDFYYSRIPYGGLISNTQNVINFIEYYVFSFLRTVKRIIKTRK